MTVLMDAEKVLNSVGGHALRVMGDGTVEVLMMSPDEKEWQDITECDLVQLAGRPARKN